MEQFGRALLGGIAAAVVAGGSLDLGMLLAEATPAGRQLARDVQPRIANLEVEWLKCLSAEEQETFVGLSGKLQASLKAFLDT